MRVDLKKKILMLAVLPSLIVGVFLCGGSVTSLRTNMNAEIEETLKATAYTLNYDDDMEHLNGYKEKLNIDVTVFHENIRVQSTVPNAVGTEADEKIYREVCDGKDYFSTNANC